MTSLLEIAKCNQRRAQAVVEATGIVGIWERFGARAELVGSMRTGLLMDKRDIDFHVYSDEFRIADSFAAIAALAENPRIKRVEYANLLDTGEACLEWHVWYEDEEADLWQIDMIHILKDSQFAGYFEEVADRICAVLTAETKEAILGIKHSLGVDSGVMSIDVYKAVIRDGVRTVDAFRKWKERQPDSGIVEWMP